MSDNMISEIRRRVSEYGLAKITVDEYNQLQAEWITRSRCEDLIADQQRVIDRMKEFIDEAAVCPDVLNMFHNFKKCDFCITKRKLLGENNG